MKKYKQHPDFKKFPHYDIAVVDTEEVVRSDFSPICLTDADSSILGFRGKLANWAPDSEDYEEEFLGTDLSVVRDRYCSKRLTKIPDHSFCVLHGYAGTRLCFGDIGAGFMIYSDDERNRFYLNRMFLRGILSTGDAGVDRMCTTVDYVIFTDVTKFLEFITSD